MSAQKILLIEDEEHLGAAIEIALEKLGAHSVRAHTLKQARALVIEHRPELVLLDLTLPDGDGLDFCRELRSSGFEGGILMLTARGKVEDRVEGLNRGADDYLAKPFSWDELGARIKALQRRTRPRSKAEESALFTLDPARLRVQGPKGWLELTPLEYKLVSYLIQAEGRIVSRDELLKNVWGFSLMPKTRTVDLFLSRLRKELEADPENPVHFLTVRGAGYRFQR